MIGELLALLDSDPAAGILAVANVREQRAKAATSGRWEVKQLGVRTQIVRYDGPASNPRRAWTVVAEGCTDDVNDADAYLVPVDAEHIAAEANPAHSLAAVRRWRWVAATHGWATDGGNVWCDYDQNGWQCQDIRLTVDEARAYLGGAA